jgi:hypothetical protein
VIPSFEMEYGARDGGREGTYEEIVWVAHVGTRNTWRRWLGVDGIVLWNQHFIPTAERWFFLG